MADPTASKPCWNKLIRMLLSLLLICLRSNDNGNLEVDVAVEVLIRADERERRRSFDMIVKGNEIFPPSRTNWVIGVTAA